MDKDLVAFLLFVFCLGLIVSMFFYARQELKAQVAITAMEQGYCSSAHPSNNSLVIWDKCKEEK